MVKKIIRKAGLGGTAVKLAKPFIKSGSSLPSLEEARAHLMALSPDPANSCLWSKPAASHGQFTLDILIPAYNVENYIARCIDSALSQKTEHSFRLIIVDDGSKDNTAVILDGYADNPRVIIKHQENQGLAGARNTAIALSDAEYIMFLDSDDILPPGSVDALIRCALENNAHITEGAFAQCDLDGNILKQEKHKSGLLEPQKELYGFACMKVFKAEIFSKLRFSFGYLYEDSIMSQIVYPLAKKNSWSAYGIEQNVYCYSVNPKGITSSSRAKPKSIDSLWITLQLYKDRQALGLENDSAYYNYILSMLVLSYRRAEAQSEQTKKAMFVLWKDFIDKEFSGFDTENKKYSILQQAVREENYPLYKAACMLI